MRFSVENWKNGAERWGRRCGEALVDLVFPPSCLLCGISLDNNIPRNQRPHLCADCVGQFGYGGAAACDVCAAPLPKIGDGVANCLYCRERGYRFHASTALGIYRSSLREAVLKMKLSHHEPLMLATGQMLAERVREAFTQTPLDYVVPVPMHWWKRLMRGANSPDLLAETIGRRLQIPTLPRLLRVRRRSRKQGTLLPGERMKNVRGVFRVSTRYDIASKHILLVDDVMTTGATANEAAKVLRRAGATRISVAVIARGVGLDDSQP